MTDASVEWRVRRRQRRGTTLLVVTIVALTVAENDAERRLARLRSRSRGATAALVALLTACQGQVEASNHAVDVANLAVDRYNSAQADLVGAFQGAGDAAITDVEQRTAAVHTALATAQQELADLVTAGG